MKKIIAILENRAVGPSRETLARLGITSVAMLPVSAECDEEELLDGAGVRPATIYDIYTVSPARRHGKPSAYEEFNNQEIPLPPAEFRPKVMLILVVANEDADLVVRSLIRLNEEILQEPGKIFVCPLISAVG